MATKDLQMYVPLFDGTNYQAWKDGLDAFTKAMKCYPPVVGVSNATQATVMTSLMKWTNRSKVLFNFALTPPISLI